MKTPASFLLGSWILFSVVLSDGIAVTDNDARQILSRFQDAALYIRAKDVAALNDKERLTLIAYYKTKLTENGRLPQGKDAAIEASQYRDTLLALGDIKAIESEVEILRASSVETDAFSKSLDGIVRAARPEAIPLLLVLVLPEEPFSLKASGDVTGIVPKSYTVAVGILKIVENSPLFNEQTRDWARENTNVSAQALKPVVQQWWHANEREFKALEYNNVKAGKDLRREDLARQHNLFAQREQYKKDLIANGKNPQEQANWERWRTEILPSLMSGGEAAKPDSKVTENQPSRHLDLNKPDVSASIKKFDSASNVPHGSLYATLCIIVALTAAACFSIKKRWIFPKK